MRTVSWSELDDAARAEVLSRGTAAAGPQVTTGVAAILRGVREGGDTALQEYAERFDSAPARSLMVGQEEIGQAASALPGELRAAIREAASNIRTFHRAGMTVSYDVETAPGVICARVVRPIRRVDSTSRRAVPRCPRRP